MMPIRDVRHIAPTWVSFTVKLLHQRSGTTRWKQNWGRGVGRSTCLLILAPRRTVWEESMRNKLSLYVAMTRMNVQRNASDEVSLLAKNYMNNLLLHYIFTGCGHIWSIDGNWKIRYPVCMYPVPKNTAAFEGNLWYIDTCPNSPAYGKAFCV